MSLLKPSVIPTLANNRILVGVVNNSDGAIQGVQFEILRGEYHNTDFRVGDTVLHYFKGVHCTFQVSKIAFLGNTLMCADNEGSWVQVNECYNAKVFEEVTPAPCMPKQVYSYAVLKYMHSKVSKEVANLGVMLFLPKRLVFIRPADISRISAIFPKADITFVKGVLDGLEETANMTTNEGFSHKRGLDASLLQTLLPAHYASSFFFTKLISGALRMPETALIKNLYEDNLSAYGKSEVYTHEPQSICITPKNERALEAYNVLENNFSNGRRMVVMIEKVAYPQYPVILHAAAQSLGMKTKVVNLRSLHNGIHVHKETFEWWVKYISERLKEQSENGAYILFLGVINISNQTNESYKTFAKALLSLQDSHDTELPSVLVSISKSSYNNLFSGVN